MIVMNNGKLNANGWLYGLIFNGFEKRNNMELENKVKQQLLSRGFTKEQLLNNRGLIGAAIDETILTVVKNLNIPFVNNNEVAVCGADGAEGAKHDRRLRSI